MAETPIMHPVIVTKITNEEYAKLPLKSLEQILDESENRVEDKIIFRTRFMAEAMKPTADNV